MNHQITLGIVKVIIVIYNFLCYIYFYIKIFSTTESPEANVSANVLIDDLIEVKQEPEEFNKSIVDTLKENKLAQNNTESLQCINKSPAKSTSKFEFYLFVLH